MSLVRRGKVWHYDFCLAGERYRGSTKETALARAHKIEALLIAGVKDRRTSILPRKAPVLSEFSTRFLQWIDKGPLEANSKRYYTNGWRLISGTELAGMRLNRITSDEVHSIPWKGAPAYVNQVIRTLRRMLSKAAEWGVIPSAPRIKLLKEYGRERLIDSAAETKLLAVARQPLLDVLLVMLDTGLRPQEVFRMRWEYVNWQALTIFNPFGKTRSSRRYVPMSERVMRALLARHCGRSEGWVFLSKRSRCGHLTTVARQFRQARKAAGLPRDVVLYCARHTFGTYALEATGNLAAVMKAMGHTSAQTTMIYQHPGIDSIRRAVETRNSTLQ